MTPPPWHVTVLIPARNEQELLPRCLASVIEARRQLDAGTTSDIVVVADRSTDRTAEIARRMLGANGQVMLSNRGTAGGARRLAADAALERLAVPLQRCWLANTDADCVVPRDWLRSQVELAAKGIHAFAGTVSVDSFAQHHADVPARFRASYLIHADGSHPHIHGANLGVRGDAYVRAGGWANLETAEDHDLWGRLRQQGSRMASLSRIEVVTSGRRVGRAPHGFADALAAHNFAQASCS